MNSTNGTFKNSSAARGCCKFATDFHKTLTKIPKGNVVHSPLGVHQILSLLFHGADGLSAEEMVAGLHLSDIKRLHLGYRDIITQINNNAHGFDMVTLVNGIFVNDGMSLTKAFKSKSTEYYQVELETAKFDNKKESADKINSWISEKTQNKINDMLDAKDITDYTQVILVNALYFKACWVSPFSTYATMKETFHISKTVQTKVSMMHKTEFYMYGTVPSLKSTFIVLPYEIGNMDMIVIRPDTIEGLKFVEKHFDWNAVINAKPSEYHLSLSLPKFRVEATNDLKEVLCNMGMKSMFESRGDFEGVCPKKLVPPLHVSGVVQKVFIDVNEMGTEAAAVTRVRLCGGGGYVEPPSKFEVDRPFIIAIRHTSSNIPLFIASVRDIGEKQSMASDVGADKQVASDRGPITRSMAKK